MAQPNRSTGTGRMAAFLAATLLLIVLVTAGTLQAQPQASPGANGSKRFVSIDFNNVDISVFIKFISELTGKNFVIDQRVKGKVTIISPSKISVAEAYRVFESVLDVHGFATVQTGKLTKVIPSPEARTRSIETRSKSRGDSADDRMVTQLIPLRYADPDTVKRLFTPMVSKSSVILSYAPTNTLIITDRYANITRLMNILKTIDIPGVGREITIFPVHNADAGKMVSLLETVFKTSPAGGKKVRPATDRSAAFVADERTNTVITVASEDATNRIRSLIEALDQKTPQGKEKIHVYYLEYAAAEEIVTVLQDLPKEEPTKAAGAKSAPVVSKDVTITADKATNSLVITADRDDYATLVEIIKQIDIPRSMVYIEALIMEVNTDKNFELGTEWQIGDDLKLGYENRTGVAAGGFNTGAGSVLGAAAKGALPQGFSMGILGEAIDIGGVKFPSIAAIVRAYKKDKDVNILSTPQLLTTDNQEASITVGKNVPYQTTATRSDAGGDVYNSYEYRDVGKTLKITPQINKDRMVRLNLELEVSSLADATTADRPTTLKRSVVTTVMVKDTNTVVIGGLIDDTFSKTEYKVPCLGEVPGLGWIFKTSASSTEKSNLYIFITPKVIQNPGEADTVSKTKKGDIDTKLETKIKLYKGESATMTPPPATTPAPAPVVEETAPAPTSEEPTVPGDTEAEPPEAQEAPAAPESQTDTTKPPVATQPASETAPVSSYLIQVESFADEKTALQSADRLQKLGHTAAVSPSTINGKTWYRVQVSGFSDRSTALASRATLAEQGYIDTLIIKRAP